MSDLAVSRKFWNDFLACPACRAPMSEWTRCEACGRSYDVENGVPKLISPKLVRVFTYRFESWRSSPGDAWIDKILREPSIEHGLGKLPYHLDPAHAVVIGRLPRGGRVLEVGCGGGQAGDWIRSLGLEYVGTDMTTDRVFDWLKQFGGPDLLCDTHFLPFLDGKFDAVYTAAVTEHLACPMLAMQEFFRVLKPGGYYLGNCAFMEPWHDQSFFHLSPLGASELLLQAGFEIEAIWPGRGYHAFKSLPRMVFRSPFSAINPLIRLAHVVYRIQNQVLAQAKRWTGRSVSRPIVKAALIAGATDWIARRPLAEAPVG